MKHLIKIESTPNGVLGVRHAGRDQQYCEAGELVTLKWQPDAKWGLQEAHYTDGDGNVTPIDLGNGNGVVAFMMPDKNITVGGTFKMFVSQDWTEGTNPSKGEVLTVGNNGEPAPKSVDELANEIAEGENDLGDAIDQLTKNVFGVNSPAEVVESITYTTAAYKYKSNDLQENVEYICNIVNGASVWSRFGFAKTDTASWSDESDVIQIAVNNASTSVGFTAPDPSVYPYIIYYLGHSSNSINVTTKPEFINGAINDILQLKTDTSGILKDDDIKEAELGVLSYITPFPKSKVFLKVEKINGNVGDFDIRARDNNNSTIYLVEHAIFGVIYEVENEYMENYPNLFLYRNEGSGTIAVDDTSYKITIYDIGTNGCNVTILKHNSNSDKNILVFGDSISQLPRTGLVTSGNGIVEYIHILTGASVIRAAIGGSHLASRLSSLPSTITSDEEARACLDVVNMVKAFAVGDMSLQQSAADWEYSNSGDKYWKTIVDNLALVDKDSITDVIVFAGTNDCNSSVALGSQNSSDETQFYGALNAIIEAVGTYIPNATLHFLTPIVRYWSNKQDATDADFSDNYVNAASLKLTDYCEAIKTAAVNYHTPFLDLYNQLGWTKFNFWNFFPDNDGTHPKKGLQHIGQMIVSYLGSYNNRY